MVIGNWVISGLFKRVKNILEMGCDKLMFCLAAKIRDFNGQVAPDLRVDPENLEYLTTMMNAKGATPLQIELLDKLLQWPIGKSDFRNHHSVSCD
jgi:hypothetical protein